MASASSVTAAAEQFLANFNDALISSSDAVAEKVSSLFLPNGAWRDVLALSNRVATFQDRDNIAAALKQHLSNSKLSNVKLAAGRTAPREVSRAGTKCLECIVSFDNKIGSGFGVLRLVPSPDSDSGNGNGNGQSYSAWTLVTMLYSIKGHVPPSESGDRRASDADYSRDFGAPNWKDKREAAAAYTDRDPVVLCVGGGQAGLAVAARLTQHGIDTLVVDPEERVGDNWRSRYHSLTLHNEVHVNHMPLMPFPPTYPVFIPKDMLADWFAAYVNALEINFWTSTKLTSGKWDPVEKRWTVLLTKNDGSTRTLHPKHLIFATGVSGAPILPTDSDLPGLSTFKGTKMHSSSYNDGRPWKGKKALVIGTGNSAHDVAQDLFSSGCTVSMVQRSKTHIVSVREAQRVYSVYTEGIPIDDCDMIALATPYKEAIKAYQMTTASSAEVDKELLAGLEKVGFETTPGEPDATGFQMLYMRFGGHYYFDVGCSGLIASGKIGLLKRHQLKEITPSGVTLHDGTTLDLDLLVLATGYHNLQHTVAEILGDQIANNLGPIWGFNEGGELRNMFGPTSQEGLWFIGGSLAQCRIWSRFMTLAIKAKELGLM